jgi:hypothetical protein
MKSIKYLFLITLFLFSGCAYKFNGASIPPDMKTVKVTLFENNAPLVVSNLSNLFTEDLKARIRNQSRLSIVENEADGVFEGRIQNYDIKPIAIQDNANPIAGANRLTITVSVKYTNNTKEFEKQSFEEVFSAYEDFSLAGQSLESQQQSLIKKVNAKLTENIFNRAFSQW